MKIVEEGDRRAAGIAGLLKVQPEEDYRLSVYTYHYAADGKHLLKSILTGAAAVLSDDEWNVLKEGGSGREIDESGLSKLAKLGFLIPKNEEDYSRYKLAVNVLKQMSREKKGVKTYTILPTLGCNARCIYCYEEGLEKRTMSIDTADRVIEFIERTRRDGRITLSWFGGEPLASADTISYICRKLDEKEIPFRSRIITNATLLTQELAEKCVKEWRLKAAQVSVDGVRDDYEARKKYVSPEKYNYDTMMQGIGLLLDQGVKVTLRCNYDRDNIDGMRAFWEDVRGKFGSYDNLIMYSAMLFQEQKTPECVEIHGRMQDMVDEAICDKIPVSRRRYKKYKLKSNFCMSDASGRCVVIDPEGLLYYCENLTDNSSFGSVTDKDVKVCYDQRADLDADEKCRTCCFLPECTPFYKNGCPDWFQYCRDCKMTEMEHEMKKLLEREAD